MLIGIAHTKLQIKTAGLEMEAELHNKHRQKRKLGKNFRSINSSLHLYR